MWKFIQVILTNGSLFIPVIGAVYLFINNRDERIKELTKMKIKLYNFNKNHSSTYKNREGHVESPSDYELEEISRIENDIRLSERKRSENLNRFLIILFVYIVLTSLLISYPGISEEYDVEFQV